MTILCLLYIIHCILNIFLRSDLLSTNSSLKDFVLPCYVAESWALLPQVKHLGIKLMHTSRWLITQVYNGQLTHVTESLTHRELQRDLFFPLHAVLCSLGSGMSLMMQSDSKMTHPAMCLDHHEPNKFSTVYAWRIKFGHTYSYIDIYYWNFFIYIWTYCTLRHIAGLIKQCQRYMFTNVDPLIDVQKLDICHREACSRCRSSRKQLS